VRAIRVAPALVLIPLAFTGSGYASLGAPTLTGPADGSTAQSPSVFAWQSVSGADHYVFQLGGASGFNPFQYAVDTKNSHRGPLLITAGGKDHTVPAGVSRATHKRYKHSTATTELLEFPDRGHSLTVDSGWQEVADGCLAWLKANGL